MSIYDTREGTCANCGKDWGSHFKDDCGPLRGEPATPSNSWVPQKTVNIFVKRWREIDKENPAARAVLLHSIEQWLRPEQHLKRK